MTAADSEHELAQGLNLRSSKDRAVLKVRKLQAELNVMLDAYLRERGAEWTDRGLGQYKLSTPLGDLTISPDPAYIAEGMLTIFARFEDVDRACAKLNPGHGLRGEVNPYSGKWNHHYDGGITPDNAFRDFKAHLENILEGR